MECNVSVRVVIITDGSAWMHWLPFGNLFNVCRMDYTQACGTHVSVVTLVVVLILMFRVWCVAFAVVGDGLFESRAAVSSPLIPSDVYLPILCRNYVFYLLGVTMLARPAYTSRKSTISSWKVPLVPGTHRCHPMRCDREEEALCSDAPVTLEDSQG